MTILTQSCNSNNELDLVGQWKYAKTKKGAIIEPFKFYCPTSYPESYPCKEIIYLTEDRIEFPLMRSNQGFSIEDKFIKYEITGERVKFFKDSLTFEYEWNYVNNKLCFDNERFCLERVNQEENTIDSTIFKFEVTQELLPSYSVWLNYDYRQDKRTCEIRYDRSCKTDEVVKIQMSDEEMKYILKLLGRIPEENLNRIYNNGLSDCREISIDFYTQNGNWKGIETCDLTNENPFEIRALTTNMLLIIHKYLKRE